MCVRAYLAGFEVFRGFCVEFPARTVSPSGERFLTKKGNEPMSTMTSEKISADEWLAIRDLVADCVQKAHPRMQADSTVKISEQLIRLGLIDLDEAHRIVFPPAEPEPEPEPDVEEPAELPASMTVEGCS